MKKTILLGGIIATCFLGLLGCKKEQAAPPAGTIQLYGINVDLPKLDTEFQGAPPDVQASVTAVKNAYRFGQFPKMVVELDKLANTASLTEPQKKLANDLIEQMKQVMSKIPQPAQ